VSIGQPHAPFAEFVRQTSNADEMRGQQFGRAVAMAFFCGSRCQLRVDRVILGAARDFCFTPDSDHVATPH
jgi:hypothetical protein